MADRYEIITWRGVRLDRYTASALERAESISGIRISPTQGSYNRGGVSQSAGTHDGGGAVDIVVVHLSREQMTRLNRAMRQVGFASWIREKIPGLWNIHIHAILVGNTKASRGALNQVAAYRNGRNGLANNGADDFYWRPAVIADAPYGTNAGANAAGTTHEGDDMPFLTISGKHYVVLHGNGGNVAITYKSEEYKNCVKRYGEPVWLEPKTQNELIKDSRR